MTQPADLEYLKILILMWICSKIILPKWIRTQCSVVSISKWLNRQVFNISLFPILLPWSKSTQITMEMMLKTMTLMMDSIMTMTVAITMGMMETMMECRISVSRPMMRVGAQFHCSIHRPPTDPPETYFVGTFTSRICVRIVFSIRHPPTLLKRIL